MAPRQRKGRRTADAGGRAAVVFSGPDDLRQRQEEMFSAYLSPAQRVMARELTQAFSRPKQAGYPLIREKVEELVAGVKRCADAFEALADAPQAVEIAAKRAYPRVEVHGLKSRLDLNGKLGIRLGMTAPSSTKDCIVRYTVHIEGLDGDVAIPVPNVRAIETWDLATLAENGSANEKTAAALALAQRTGLLGGEESGNFCEVFNLFAALATAMAVEPAIAHIWDLPALVGAIDVLSKAVFKVLALGSDVSKERVIDSSKEADMIFQSPSPDLQSPLGSAVIAVRSILSVAGGLAQLVLTPAPTGSATWSNDPSVMQRMADIAAALLVRNYVFKVPTVVPGVDEIKHQPLLIDRDAEDVTLTSSLMNWVVAKDGIEQAFISAFNAAGTSIADVLVSCWNGLASHSARQLSPGEATAVNVTSHLCRHHAWLLPAVIKSGEHVSPATEDQHHTLAALCEKTLRHVCATSPEDFFFRAVIAALCDLVDEHLCQFMCDQGTVRTLAESVACIKFANELRAGQFPGLIVREVIRGTIPFTDDGPITSIFCALNALTIRAHIERHSEFDDAEPDLRTHCVQVARQASDCHRALWKAGAGHAVLAFFSKIDLSHARENRLFDRLGVNPSILLGNLVDDLRGAAKYLPVVMYDFNAVAALHKISQVTNRWTGLSRTDPASFLAAAINQLSSALSVDPESTPMFYICGGCGLKSTPETTFKVCGGCRTERYCSARCQRAKWPTHKVDCTKIRLKLQSGPVDPKRAQNTRDIERQVHGAFWNIAEERIATTCFFDKIDPARLVVEVDLRKGPGTYENPAPFRLYDEGAFYDGKVPKHFMASALLNASERATVAGDVIDRIRRRQEYASAGEQVVTVALFGDRDGTVYRTVMNIHDRVDLVQAFVEEDLDGVAPVGREAKIEFFTELLRIAVYESSGNTHGGQR